jgi:photosynthetic reaction center cytochrome c subunit
MVPLTDVFPAERHGPTGDVAKINCMTCHQGQSKPLNGLSMLAESPELARIRPPPAPAAVVDPAAPEAAPTTGGPSADDIAAAGAARDAAAAQAMGKTGA